MDVRGTQSPWMATMGEVTRKNDPLLQAKQEGESIAVVFTVSLRNINQLTVTTLKGYPTGGGACQTISCV